MPFRFHAKKVGLTYSCPRNGACADLPAGEHEEGCECVNPIDDHEVLIEFLASKGDNEYIVGKELHASGKVHWHAYAKYANIIDTTDVRFFDCEGVHPNIINKPGKGWITYCTKEREWKSNFYENSPYQVAMQLESLEECVSHLMTKVPRDLCLNMAQIEYAFTKLHKPKEEERPLMNFSVPFFTEFERAIIIEGESGWGKTQFALRCFARPLLVRAIEDLRELRPNEHDGVVFDDMSFTHWPRQTQIHLVDIECHSSLPARYRNVRLPARMPRIFTCNPGHRPVDLADAAIHRRCRVVELFGDIRVIE